MLQTVYILTLHVADLHYHLLYKGVILQHPCNRFYTIIKKIIK